MSPEKGPFLKESFSSNHQFLGGMLVIRGLDPLKPQVLLLMEEILHHLGCT